MCTKDWSRCRIQKPSTSTITRGVRVGVLHLFVVTRVTGTIPVKVEDGETIINYIVLFTCTSTRAIHLEVAPDLTTQMYISKDGLRWVQTVLSPINQNTPCGFIYNILSRHCDNKSSSLIPLLQHLPKHIRTYRAYQDALIKSQTRKKKTLLPVSLSR